MRTKNHLQSGRRGPVIKGGPHCGLTQTVEFLLLCFAVVLFQTALLCNMLHHIDHGMLTDIRVHSDVHNPSRSSSAEWKTESSSDIMGITRKYQNSSTPELTFLLNKGNKWASMSVLEGDTTQECGNQPVQLKRSLQLPPSIDIIVIGSFTRIRRLQTQRSIYTRHPAVRLFFDITEYNDTESTCHTDLTRNEVEAVVDHCKQDGRRALGLDVTHPMLYQLSAFFYDLLEMTQQNTRSGAGWLCAQKRLVDGFVKVLRGYNVTGAALSEYIILMDDDTYINMDRLVPHLTTAIKDGNEVPRIIAGCRLSFGTNLFTVAWGGFSTMFNRQAIQNLMMPIVCNVENTGTISRDLFIRNACATIAQDQIGERALFEDGMSILDLLHRYTFDQAYLEVTTGSWNRIGSCFHSDWLISYFVSAYRIAPTNEDDDDTKISCSLEPFKNTSHMNKYYRNGECIHNGRSNCRMATATICHRLGSRGLAAIQRKIRVYEPNRSNDSSTHRYS